MAAQTNPRQGKARQRGRLAATDGELRSDAAEGAERTPTTDGADKGHERERVGRGSGPNNK